MNPIRNDYKIAFFDIDGTTVITSEGFVRQPAAEALRRLKAAGVKICTATGRPPIHVKSVADAVGGLDYRVSCNGCVVLDSSDQIIYEAPIVPETFDKICQYAKENHAGLAFHFSDHTYLYDNDEQIHWHYSRVKEGSSVLKEHPTKDRHLRKGQGQYPYDALFVVEDEEALLQFVKELGDMRTDRPWPHVFDVFCDGQSKAQGIEAILQAEGLTWNDVICFGDSDNDLEMLEKAALGVCMGNGSERAKAVAGYIAEPIDQDGLAKAIDDIFGF